MLRSRKRESFQITTIFSLSIVVIGIIGVLALIPTNGSSATSGKELPQPHIAILQRPMTNRDKLPEGFQQLPVNDRLQDVSRVRLAIADAERHYYIAPAINDELCLLSTSGSGEQLMASGTCEKSARLATSGIYLGETDASGLVKVAMIVPDGVTAIRTDQGNIYDVKNNVALIPASSPKTLQFVGGAFDGVMFKTNFGGVPIESK
ncbi:hypothetical protein [Herpetosiphon giganteus]|uniref:hypothetical protein n=1 Tax=Herpetosiphon giganteus TaxID=2029754 RepID=UPI00195A76CD|nr:hypothetical protein [Herpetosiphon giganteus]MBM7845162.1 hypothetical protein [Herpetosiphon giganteus]